MNQQTFWIIATAVVFLIAMGMAGGSDYDMAKSTQAEYCENVKSGFHPDYNHIYAKECAK